MAGAGGDGPGDRGVHARRISAGKTACGGWGMGMRVRSPSLPREGAGGWVRAKRAPPTAAPSGTHPPPTPPEGRGRQPHVVAIDYGSKRNIFRNLVKAGAKVTVLPATATFEQVMALRPRRLLPLERPRRSGRDRGICRAGDPAAARHRAAAVRHLPRPPAARARGGRADDQDVPGPPRRQPSGQAAERRRASRSPA